jgi:FlaG/FlaF family flagellin (archaellin)
MKGISTIIAVILMLTITIALASTAYILISGMPATKGLVLSVVDSYCVGGTATFVIRNEGMTTISAAAQTRISIDEACATDFTLQDIPAGGTVTYQSTGCATGRKHTYRLRGPANAVELSVFCS